MLSVAVDDGHAETKVVAFRDGELILEMAIPSRARSGLHATTEVGTKDGVVGSSYTTEGCSFYVGNFHDSETTRFDGYPFSGMNRSIVHHALRLAQLGGEDINLATGLPLSTFYANGKKNAEVIQNKIDSLSISIEASDGKPVANITKHSVFPEGLAAYIDYAMDANGIVIADLDKTIGVVDIGGKTTDIAVVLPQGTLDHSRSGSENIGVLDLIEALGPMLKSKFGFLVPEILISESLKSGSIKVRGESHDITQMIRTASAGVLERIYREISRRLGSAADLDLILLVGGGANIFSDATKLYPHMSIPDNPQFSNARGFAKFMLMHS